MNSVPPNCKSSALTTRTRCLPYFSVLFQTKPNEKYFHTTGGVFQYYYRNVPNSNKISQELRAMSLLFSVRAPQKSDISPLLQPSLDALLSVCRRYQNKKQENAKATRAASETEQQQKNEESEDKKTSGEVEPVKKRRRTLEGEEQTSSKGASASSDVPGPSKDDDSAAVRKREKVQSSSQKQSPKSGSIWGSRPPTDCVDSLVKAIQSAITKIPV